MGLRRRRMKERRCNCMLELGEAQTAVEITSKG